MDREIAEVPVGDVRPGQQVTYGGQLFTVLASHPLKVVLRNPFDGTSRTLGSDARVLTDVRSLRPVLA